MRRSRAKNRAVPLDKPGKGVYAVNRLKSYCMIFDNKLDERTAGQAQNRSAFAGGLPACSAGGFARCGGPAKQNMAFIGGRAIAMAGRRPGLPRPAAIVEKMSGAPGQCRRIFPPQRPGAFVLPRPFAPGGKEECTGCTSSTMTPPNCGGCTPSAFRWKGRGGGERLPRAGRRDLYPAAHQRHRDRVLPRHAGTVRRLDAFPRRASPPPVAGLTPAPVPACHTPLAVRCGRS